MTDNETLFTQSEIAEVNQRDETLTTRVTRLVENLVIGGRLQPGDRLPPVRELAAQFGVSATVVREAVRSLVAKGLLEVRHGSGMTVRSPSTQVISQTMTLLLRVGPADLDYGKVHEIRSVLEIEIAGLAALRRTETDMQYLEANMAETERLVRAGLEQLDQRERFVQIDVSFHAILAQATQNELFTVLLDSVVDILRTVRVLSLDIPGAYTHALRYHRAILDQVRAQSAEGAREAMREHLVDSAELMQRGLKPPADGANIAL